MVDKNVGDFVANLLPNKNNNYTFDSLLYLCYNIKHRKDTIFVNLKMTLSAFCHPNINI